MRVVTFNSQKELAKFLVNKFETSIIDRYELNENGDIYDIWEDIIEANIYTTKAITLFSQFIFIVEE